VKPKNRKNKKTTGDRQRHPATEISDEISDKSLHPDLQRRFTSV